MDEIILCQECTNVDFQFAGYVKKKLEYQYSNDFCYVTCKPFMRKNYLDFWLLHVHTCTFTIIDPCSYGKPKL